MNISDLNISEIVDKAKDTLGLEPQEAEDGAYTPSKASLKLAAPNKTNYDHSEYEAPYRGNKKILMVCTERQYCSGGTGSAGSVRAGSRWQAVSTASPAPATSTGGTRTTSAAST